MQETIDLDRSKEGHPSLRLRASHQRLIAKDDLLKMSPAGTFSNHPAQFR
jgi:hypothetical protein